MFTGGIEPVVKWAFLLLAASGGLTAVAAWRGRRSWARYSLIGMLPGSVIGGIGFAVIVWLGSGGRPDGWEGLVVVAAGIFGAFVGTAVGAVSGGAFGWPRDRRADTTGS